MKKIIKYLPLILIILFLGLYFSYQNGYYDKYMRDKINLTNQNIERFEKDIIDGRDVSIEDYIEENKNYDTKISNLSLKVSNKLENIISKGIKYIFNKISNVIE